MNEGRPFRLGAHVEGDGVRFAAFADASQCSVALTSADGAAETTLSMAGSTDGYFELFVPGLGAGARYWFVVDGKRLPDPYARSLPEGVHGPAEVVTTSFVFEHALPSRSLAEKVIYELHVGTFTEEGTFEAARRRLPALVELGVTTIEIMPVAAFAGNRGWGYDGVALFAPHAAYGSADELRALVDAAHGLGLGVLLDVVYNHFGPSGNYLAAYSSRYFQQDLHNPWGQAPNFAEPALRELVLENARYWLEQFAFDGLRLDATHSITDPSTKHILSELAELGRGLSPPRLLIAEDERNLAELVTTVGLHAIWADDFHHQLRVTMTNERSGYYAAYERSVQGIADAINRGWIYAGQRHAITGTPRGSSADALPAEALVYCIQNHDQVGNRAFGERLSAQVGHGWFRGASLLLLFLPMTPLLFMGQEWASNSPFLYFTDHEPELGKLVTEGRRREFAAFPEFADPELRRSIPDPQSPSTFQASKLRWSERELPEHRQTFELYRAALALRRQDPVLARTGREQLLAQASGDVLTVQRWLNDDQRVLVMNLQNRQLPLARVGPGLRLRGARTLLSSEPQAGEDLPPGAAVVLAGSGNLAGLVESKS
jgi:maltooligosyltrehalose trehalohydrolase